MKLPTRWARAGLLLGMLAAMGPAAAAGDWPGWRGKGRDAHAPEDAGGPWPRNLTHVWRVEVDPGLSSPVVADGRIYLAGRDGDDEVVSCLDLGTGDLLWTRSYPAPFFANGGAISERRYPASRGKGPFATPAVASGGLFTLGVERTLSRFDARTGDLRWRHRLLPAKMPDEIVFICPDCGCSRDGEAFDGPGRCPDCGMALNPRGLETSARLGGGNYYGAAASPLILDDQVVVHVGSVDAGFLMAFDRESGKKRWESSGPIIGYASPVEATLHGVGQIVALAREGLLGVAASDGERLWTFPMPSNAHVVTPVVAGDRIIAAEYRGPIFALRIRKDEAGWSAAEVWRNGAETVWLSSPVRDGATLYGFFFSEKGHFAALDADTGKTLWRSEGRQGESAALVAAGDALVGLRDDGSLVVFQRTREAFRPIRSYALADSPTWTYPVLVGRDVLVRDAAALTLWRREPDTRPEASSPIGRAE